MAPRKPDPDLQASSTAAAKMSSDRVSKSKPKRGYHKYRNGLMNVKPKGEYIAMTEKNREHSPLLRLPAEIRNEIFKYALGGRTWILYKATGNMRNAKKNSLSLLRVCRQTYAETAILPFQSSIFQFLHPHEMLFWLRTHRARREAITEVSFDHRDWMTDQQGFSLAWRTAIKESLLLVPSLKRIHVIYSLWNVILNSNPAVAYLRERKFPEKRKSVAQDVEITFMLAPLLGDNHR